MAMTAGRVPKRIDWRVADGVRVEELDGCWLALDPAGGVVYRLEARAAEVMRLVAHRLPLPGHLVPAARELAGHGVLEHPFVDRRAALVGAGVVTLTGLAATLLPSAARAASTLYTTPDAGSWPVAGGSLHIQDLSPDDYYVHIFTTSGSLVVTDAAAIAEVSIIVVAGGGGGGRGAEGCGGGGGAGGVLEVTSAVLSNTTYTVTVGDGGPGRSGSSGTGVNGSDSRLTGTGVDLTALGGGGGGGPRSASSDGVASVGGSGGGGGADDGGDDSNAGADVATVGRASTITLNGTGSATFLGNAGGNGDHDASASRRRAGGGGGAGGAGVSGVSGSIGGIGGFGILRPDFEIAGQFTGQFAGGGGGAAYDLNQEGRGGGGRGGSNNSPAGQSGASNTGGGGGGSTSGVNGGNGGSGIVLVRYRLA